MINPQEQYMHRCLQLAKLGQPFAAPNPSVGAVLVKDNQIIGEGHTQPYGKAHAEVVCINNVKDKKLIAESVLYVSLEPCSHFGKTPPCANLIVESGIKKVVIGRLDPNPKVAGKGMQFLTENGVEVVANFLSDECTFQHRKFLVNHSKNRPYIILKWAQTKDGFFAPNDNSQFWITNALSKQLVHQWRHQESAILVGANTLKIDQPKLNVRGVEGTHPLRIYFVNNFNTSQFHSSLHKGTIFIGNNNENGANIDVEIIDMHIDSNNIVSILEELLKYKVQSIIVEGGRKTLDQFIGQNLWDEARIFTGDSVLNEGVFAPILDGKLISDYSLNEDNCRIYMNNNL